MQYNHEKMKRSGGVYIAVLGTSLIAATLGLASITVARIQIRQLNASADIRQAQMNAAAAVQLGLLEMKQDPNWRTTYSDLDVPWFTRPTGAGACSLRVMPADPLDDDAANAALFADPSTAVKLVGIGRHGQAEQLAELIVAPKHEPRETLRAAAEAAEAGAPLASQAATLDWDALVAEYQSQGTQINLGSLPTQTCYFSRNMSFTGGTTNFWTGNLPELAEFDDATGLNVVSFDGHTDCLQVVRSSRLAGAANRLNVALLKPNTDYQMSVEVNPDLDPALQILLTLIPAEENGFRISLIVEYLDGTTTVVRGGGQRYSGVRAWRTITDTLRTPPWTVEPANVYLVVNSDFTDGTSQTFYLDNLQLYEGGARFVYQKALGPGVNPFGAANPNGIYWINCGGNNIVIERSRILGTLLLLNPGANSRLAGGPVHMAPYLPGYPALVVQGNFLIGASRRGLGEVENSISEQAIVSNFNPGGSPGTPGMPFDFGNGVAADSQPDADSNDIYPSQIRGLVAVSGNLTVANSPIVQGPVIVGGSITNSAAMDVDFQAASLLNPPPGFQAQDSHQPRPGSASKVVLP